MKLSRRSFLKGVIQTAAVAVAASEGVLSFSDFKPFFESVAESKEEVAYLEKGLAELVTQILKERQAEMETILTQPNPVLEAMKRHEAKEKFSWRGSVMTEKL